MKQRRNFTAESRKRAVPHPVSMTGADRQTDTCEPEVHDTAFKLLKYFHDNIVDQKVLYTFFFFQKSNNRDAWQLQFFLSLNQGDAMTGNMLCDQDQCIK